MNRVTEAGGILKFVQTPRLLKRKLSLQQFHVLCHKYAIETLNNSTNYD